MHVFPGDRVRFGPPGQAKVLGVVVRGGHPKCKIRQLEAGHGHGAGATWDVPTEDAYIDIVSRAPKRASKPPPAPPPKPRRSSRPPPPVLTAKGTARGQTGDFSSHHESTVFAMDLLRQWAIPNYHVKFSTRLTNAMGKCNYRARLITLSTPLWERGTPEERKQTIIHEVAHAIVGDRHGWQNRTLVAPHGHQWKAQMRAMGAPPDVYHRVSTAGLGRKKINMSCCGKPYAVTPQKAHKIVTSTTIRCRRCAQAPVFASDEDRRKYETWLHGGRIHPNTCRCGDGWLECGLTPNVLSPKLFFVSSHQHELSRPKPERVAGKRRTSRKSQTALDLFVVKALPLLADGDWWTAERLAASLGESWPVVSLRLHEWISRRNDMERRPMEERYAYSKKMWEYRLKRTQPNRRTSQRRTSRRGWQSQR